MFQTRSLLVAPLFACFLGLANTASAQTALELGSPAPAIKVGSWVQGKPVANFQKGQIYVLEFWATWCGPCFKAMPHLSELSEKYKAKATFVGVNVWEDRDGGYTAPKKVADFMKANPGRMSYAVAIDTKESSMANGWLKAAKINSIPTTVVIDGEGKVAFIGHPMELDVVLEQVVAGKFDGKAYANKPKNPDTARVEAALAKKDIATLRKEADYIGKTWPLFVDMAESFRMVADYLEKPASIDSRIQPLIEKDKGFMLGYFFSNIIRSSWATKEQMSDVARWAEQTVAKESPEGIMVYMVLFDVYKKLPDEPKLKEVQKRFLDFGKKMGLDEKTLQKIIDQTNRKESGAGL